MVLRCCVPGCQSKGRFGFHKFPRDEENCFKWQCASRKRNISTKYLPFSAYRVCDKHFKNSDYSYRLGRKRLNKVSVPSLLVPEVESVLEEHSYVEISNKTQESPADENVAPNTKENSLRAPICSKKTAEAEPYLEDIGAEGVDESAVKLKQEQRNNVAPNTKEKSLRAPMHSTNKKTAKAEPCLENIGPDIVDEYEVKLKQEQRTENVRPRLKARINNKQSTDQIPPYIHRQLRYKDARIKTLQKKLKDANNFGKEKVVIYLSRHFNKNQMIFFEMQLRNTGKKNHGQRYTNEEKSMMLAIYKRGPRAYRYLSLLFGLPSVRTLCRHSAQLKFDTGINPKLFELLKSTASKLSDVDRLCTIGWDEMAVTHHLSYCDSNDFIDGFVDLGDTQVTVPDFATHSLTFMIRGVSRPFKQPVAYFFTQNMSGKELAEVITLVIRAVIKTGMKIIGSVCDQTGTMAAAVNRLINPHVESMKQTGMLLAYHIDGIQIVHCFDPPHILKTIRNNLLVKNLKHFVTDFYDPNIELDEYERDIEAVANWDDIKDFYKFDSKNICKLVPKIRKNHIECEKEKMKVSNAAQIFSRTFGSVLLFCSQKKLLDNDCSGTAYILLFVNNLFDSLNGGGKPVENTFRGPINEENKKKYFKFWEYAIANLEKMDFVDKETEKTNNRSSVIFKTISTVKGYMELTKICFSLGVKSVSLRQMNQDGLENFFGGVRSVCHNSKTPIPPQFRSGYTTLILTNLSSKHSIGGNCEEDGNTSLLRNVAALYEEEFIEKKPDNAPKQHVEFDPESVIDLEVSIDELAELKFIENEALIVESSKVCKSIASTIKCESCKNTLEAYCPLKEHEIITFSDSHIPVLTYPTLTFMSCFKMIFRTVEIILPFICHEKSLLQKIVTSLDKIDFDGIGCEEHKLEVVAKIKKTTANLCLTNFIKEIDGIFTKRITEPKPNQSMIHKKAFEIIATKKGIGKNGQQMIL